MHAVRSPRASSVSACIMLSVCGLLASSASAGPVEAVHTIAAQQPSNPKSNVPGGTFGNPSTQFTNFNNEIHRSPDGLKWMIVPTTNATPATQDQVFIIGQALTSTVFAQEGVTQINPGGPTAEFINFSRLDVPRINDAGQWTMGFRLNFTGATTFDERVVRFSPGLGFDLVIKPNDVVPARPAVLYSGGFGSATITQTGALGFMALIDLAAANNDSAFTSSGGAFAIEQFVTIPSGATETWQDIDAGTFLQDATGANWIALGEVGIDTSIDKVAVVNGAVVAREGSILTGSGFASAVSTISEGWMESDGSWFVRGANADGVTWIMRSGTVIAASGLPITPGSPELWETFRDVKGDNSGNYVINGNTNGGTLTDDVLVFNGKRVLARESDGIDANSNGLADDNLFLHLVQDRGALLSDDFFYFASRLKDSAAGTTGAGGSNNATLLRVRVCRADFDDSGAVAVQDIFDFLNAWFAGVPRSNFNGQGGVSVQDIFDFLNAWFAGC